nr:hypothetical protein [uncultured Chryseobacterium sp.]
MSKTSASCVVISLAGASEINGNIAEVDWKTATVSNGNSHRYGYVYDGLNRLSAGFYQRDTDPSMREYYEKVTYDLNGNIQTLERTTAAKFCAGNKNRSFNLQI